MECIVLGQPEEAARKWQYAVEDLGADWRCAIAGSSVQAEALLRRPADVLLLLRGSESAALLTALSAAPPLSPPWVLGVGMDAPDGNLDDAAHLPGLLLDWRSTGRLPSLAERHFPLAQDIAAALLRAMEVPARLRAWEFLPEMAALTVVHPRLLTDLRHGLYPLIGRRHGLTPGAVERRLRLCVESTWSRSSLPTLERFFGSSVDPERGKPTNREFLCRVQEKLTFSMQRLM